MLTIVPLLTPVAHAQPTTAPSATAPSTQPAQAAVIVLGGVIDNFNRDTLFKRFEQARAIGADTVILRIDTYGGLNKRLVALRISHDDPVPRGTRLLREEDGEVRDLGVVTSWAYSFALDAGVALGYVKRRHQEPGTVFRLGDTAGEAVIVDLPIRRGTASITGSSA